MQELTDDQLDGLFRKSAEEFEAPYDPAAWPIMEKKLDDQDKTVFWRRLLRWRLPVLLLFLLTGGGWLAYQMQKTDRGPANARPVLQAGKPSIAPVGNVAHGSLQRTNAKPRTHDQKGRLLRESPLTNDVASLRIERGSRPVSISRKELAASRLPAGGNVSTKPAAQAPVPRHLAEEGVRLPKTTRLHKTPGFASRRQTPDFATSGYALKRLNDENKQAADDNVVVFGYNRVPDQTNAIDENADRLLLPTLQALQPLSGRWPELPGQIDRDVEQPETEKLAEKPRPTRLTGLSVRLVVSPDLTAIGLKSFTRPGANVGALIEYELMPRLSLQSGVLRGTKLYRALPSDYGNSAISSWYVKPESVVGNCDMLDIPINLRYDLMQRPRATGQGHNRLFVSGGVSTYVMLNEDYTYNYANPNDPRIKYRQWSTHTGRYEFSHLNLSVGYERALTRRFSWQIEPFMKTSLKGVGFFKLNLLSTGAFFSVRYRL